MGAMGAETIDKLHEELMVGAWQRPVMVVLEAKGGVFIWHPGDGAANSPGIMVTLEPRLLENLRIERTVGTGQQVVAQTALPVRQKTVVSLDIAALLPPLVGGTLLERPIVEKIDAAILAAIHILHLQLEKAFLIITVWRPLIDEINSCDRAVAGESRKMLLPVGILYFVLFPVVMAMPTEPVGAISPQMRDAELPAVACIKVTTDVGEETPGAYAAAIIIEGKFSSP